NIEWRAVYFADTALQANYELRLYEGQTRFDIIYGTVSNGNTSATAGVQKNDTVFTQYFCNGSGGAASGGQSYTQGGVCPTPTPSPTPTPTATPCGTSKIYNIAGFNAAGMTNTNRIYDIPTNTWTTGAPLPVALSDMATAYANGKIYVAAGNNGAAVNTLY